MESVRKKVLERFGRVFEDEKKARDLEVCVYNWCVRTSRIDDIPRYWANPAFRFRYTTKALSMQFNLTNPKNPGLLAKIESGEMGLKKLVRASPAELFPDLWEPVFEKVVAKQMRRQLTVDATDAPDGAFTCGRCKSKKTVYYQLQIRASDEPMTTFVNCLGCNKRWKC